MLSVNVIIIVALIKVTFAFTDWKCTFLIIMQVIKKLMQKVSTEPCDFHETLII